MDLRQLEYFLAVVEHGGVHRAAAALHVAQPSLSQSLRRLERDLQTDLFHRVGRGLVLAPAGEALVGPARQVLRSLGSAYDAVREVRDLEAGRIDVASLADLSADPAAIWVAQFRVENPRVSARIEERGGVPQVADLVASGECEVGVSVLPHPRDGLVHERLLTQHFVLVAPPGTDGGFSDAVRLADLDGVPLVLGERHATTREWIEGSLRAADVEPLVSVEVPQRGAVLPMVLNGGGAAIVPLRLALDALLRDAVVRELVPPLRREIGVIYRLGPLTAATEAFLDFTRDRVRSWERAVERRMATGLGRVQATAAIDLAVRRRQRTTFADRSPVARIPSRTPTE
ncbi:LysR family transcriptional regulator [Pseudonocardia zijingensis]|uniref:HTH lysR-type domain-containing protein n=1 Tax=Pseudonocardia zijingensis TaxID=153376 RepID=A0ABP3ZWY6_9PSEU